MANEDRLISANKLMDAINFEYDLNYGEILTDPRRFADMVEDAPTVDAEEVVHGRWLKLSPWNNHTQSCLCLNCDSISYQKKSGVYIGKIPNYCPNCGAKMDGDGNG